MFDVLIVSGLSRFGVRKFSIHSKFWLKRNGKVMDIKNLKESFGKNIQIKHTNTEPPLLTGIYLYDYLTKKKFDCRLINCLDLEMDKLHQYAKEGFRIAALSTSFLPFIQSVKKATAMIREAAPDVFLVAGGQFIYRSYILYGKRKENYDTKSCEKDYFFLNKDSYYYQDIDMFIMEEQGELTLSRIVKNVKENRSVYDIKNIAYYKNDQLVFNDREEEDNSFEDNLISWDKIDESYLGNIIPLQGSRGCPFRCNFCNFNIVKFRSKPVELLEKELDMINKIKKVRMVRFTDDNFFLNRGGLEKVCNMMRRKDYSFTWTSFVRASSISSKNVTLLKNSKFAYAVIGMESGDNTVLKNMGKMDNTEHYKEAVEVLNKNGISTTLSFIVGFPGETRDTVNNTIETINSFFHEGPAINTIQVFPFYLVPLAPIFALEEQKKYGLEGYMDAWKHNTMDFVEAEKLAKDMMYKLKNIYPYYNWLELEPDNAKYLKDMCNLRFSIRKKELRGVNQVFLEKEWQKLEKIVTEDLCT